MPRENVKMRRENTIANEMAADIPSGIIIMLSFRELSEEIAFHRLFYVQIMYTSHTFLIHSFIQVE